MRVFAICLLGAITGAVVTAIWGPEVVTWWGTPPVRTTCDCSANMTWAMNRLVWAQLTFTVLGAFAFLGLYMAFFRRRRVVVTT